MPGKYQYRIGILNGNTTSLNCRIYSQPLSVNINAYPAINLPKDTSVCEGQELQLQTLSTGDTYEWSGPNGFASTEQNPIVAYVLTQANSGIYSLKVTANGCPSFATATVTVSPPITATVSDNTVVCAGSSVALSVQSKGGLYYKWTPSTGLTMTTSQRLMQARCKLLLIR